MQEEPSSLQKSANTMHIQTWHSANANFPVKVSGVNVIVLYDTGASMSFMSYACYMKLKKLPSLKMISAMSLHSATGYDFMSHRIDML